jgi:6-phosphogluconolactonase
VLQNEFDIPASHGVVRVHRDADQLADEAARRFAEIAKESVERHGRFTVALSGGSTPKAMFARLAGGPYVSFVPWTSTLVFWVDERCIPPNHPDSNYKSASELLLSKVPVSAANIYRIPAEIPDHASAARQYSDTVANVFAGAGLQNAAGDAHDLPRFDLILLGLGDDGHTASLFPDSDALKSGRAVAVANYVEKLGAYRITLTPAVINNARNVIFLVAGESKAHALRNALESGPEPEAYPSQLVKPAHGTLLWMVDFAAASLLSDQRRSGPAPRGDSDK